MIDHYLAMSPGPRTQRFKGSIPKLWFTRQMDNTSHARTGRIICTVVDPFGNRDLFDRNYQSRHEILGRQDVQTLLDHVKQNYPAVVNDLVPGFIRWRNTKF